MDYYEPVWGDPIPELNKKFQELIKIGLTTRVISKDESRFLLIQQPNKPLFYHIPKIHKDLQNPPDDP